MNDMEAVKDVTRKQQPLPCAAQISAKTEGLTGKNILNTVIDILDYKKRGKNIDIRSHLAPLKSEKDSKTRILGEKKAKDGRSSFLQLEKRRL